MPVQSKICGLSTPETLAAAIRHDAAYVGLVFFAKSPRHLDFDRAAALAAMVPGHVRKVGVVVNADDAFLDKAVVAAGLDVLQLHGSEAPERAAHLKSRYGLEIWKAIPVKTRADLDAAARYRAAVDRVLYDAKTPDAADLPGGMGLRFDWRLLEGFAHPLPWALSGGLDARNLAEAVGVTGAPLVDTSSGVESSPGVKDVDKIAAFLQSASQL
ncbi:phosphoribosylanthranilate isomerase [Sphingomonas laterariae]|uniref:N-(5'-phosphoribosyl)anthranilate isomerase n=1 Tax=Edaphosphingomonas laterariae TaxID=861865 RepID=A0A239BK44_9SPHN|nr:phosphoribosylanthranilate isomerase [Sphingomonas laterariae]SNS08360.1 phosphoribosylanthranilate isomerase [Sphingomonas laterariae]